MCVILAKSTYSAQYTTGVGKTGSEIAATGQSVGQQKILALKDSTTQNFAPKKEP